KWWLLPRARELRACQSAADARAHCSGVVLHSVLRDFACGTEQAVRCRVDGYRGRFLLLPAVARPREGEVDSLSRLAVQGIPVLIRGQLRRPWLSRLDACDTGLYERRAYLRDHLLRV